MALEFEYRVEDFSEAAVAQAQFYAGQIAHGQRVTNSTDTVRLIRGLIVFAVLIGTAICIFASLGLPYPPSGHKPPAPPMTHNFWKTMLLMWVPAFLMIAFICFFSLRGERRIQNVPFYSPLAPARPIFGRRWVVLLVWIPLFLALADDIAMAASPSTPNWAPSAAALTLVACAPWVVCILVGIRVFGAIGKAEAKNRLGVTGGSFRQPYTIEVSDRGVVWRNPFGSRDEYWCYFVSFLESDHLLLLFTKDLSVHIVPKRAFSAQSLDLFCGLIQARVPAGQFLPRVAAFPAPPSSPVLPILPIEG